MSKLARQHRDKRDRHATKRTPEPCAEVGRIREPLAQADRQALLRIARQALTAGVGGGRPSAHEASPALTEVRAAFVTLWRRDTGELRGCRGECRAQRPLADSVAAMAVAAAIDDPRFMMVTLDELPMLRIEINALTPLHPIEPEEIVVGRHGLLIIRGGHAGLLLPEVPTRFGWNREEFLEALCRKAYLTPDAWEQPDAQLYGFESEEWGEET